MSPSDARRERRIWEAGARAMGSALRFHRGSVLVSTVAKKLPAPTPTSCWLLQGRSHSTPSWKSCQTSCNTWRSTCLLTGDSRMHLSWNLKCPRPPSLAIFISLWFCWGGGSLLNSTVPQPVWIPSNKLVAAPSSSPFLPF